MPRPILLLISTALLLQSQALAAPPAPTPAPTPAPPAQTVAPSEAEPTAEPAAAPVPPPADPAAARSTPNKAEQSVLERIRRLRDGDSRRYGNCSYRWDRWKLLKDGTRTTQTSCGEARPEGGQAVPAVTSDQQLVGVNCAKLQINTTSRMAATEEQPERWVWGRWRLPAAGGEEQMVAALCANALPVPPVPAGNQSGAATSGVKTAK
ncbi:MAG: hypothetical protein ACKOXO_10140 [Cyanobium sp.]